MEVRLLRYFVAVAEERHVGRAAVRLHMSQPPLSRAIRQLEQQLGVTLLERTPRGVELTRAGTALHREARTLLERIERLPARLAAVDEASIAVGTCADTAEQIGSRLVTEFRRRYPQVDLTLHEFDLNDPSAGLRADLVDVALTRTPFDQSEISTRTLQRDQVGVVMLDDDPLAGRRSVTMDEVRDRHWVRLPGSTDTLWAGWWLADGGTPNDNRPLVRTIQECLQSVLWSNASTMAPLYQVLPEGLVNVPISDKEPSQIVAAWRSSTTNPLVPAFVEIAEASVRK